MLKMVIQMDEAKIHQESKYRLDGIYQTIDDAFAKMELPRMEDASGARVYRDTGKERDYGRFGVIVNSFKRQPWFMDNVSVWRFCDSDDSEDADTFEEEDLLNHYRNRAWGA